MLCDNGPRGAQVGGEGPLPRGAGGNDEATRRPPARPPQKRPRAPAPANEARGRASPIRGAGRRGAKLARGGDGSRDWLRAGRATPLSLPTGTLVCQGPRGAAVSMGRSAAVAAVSLIAVP